LKWPDAAVEFQFQIGNMLLTLEDTSMLNCRPVDTPIEPNVKIVHGQEEPLKDPGHYWRLNGSSIILRSHDWTFHRWSVWSANFSRLHLTVI